ncbi:acetate kinase [Volvox carteri f. nagariensis]|uniref:Probable acetate kinase n=1 Tax=Volvox carteri f. nagariensis TaxID=3068 RepID=D8TQ81_VOLCA|nr:acetate kinase [Volvox carteri f. nagariensis]EFJ50488.1 acetate kinase [Volvox carteri f. nagariensis]|eukprot:XP_002948613.1 acetate kinase [Volvox carteri f. nagariensis]
MLTSRPPIGQIPTHSNISGTVLPPKLLVLNAGSSSLKFKIFGVNPLIAGMSGMFDRIGDSANCTLKASSPDPLGGKSRKWELKLPAADHTCALQEILDFISDNVSGSFSNEVVAVGHRIVHGLDISAPVLLDSVALERIREAAVFAPLHNPAGLQGIEAAQNVFSGVPQVAVFDTAFHATMPPHAYMYGIPYDLYDKHHIRRYGFHGTSHKYLVEQAAAMLGKDVSETNVITCHLGNGSSVAAVRGGRCVDTSMGMTPLEGLLMGTRCGDVDPAVVLHIETQLGLSAKETDTLLNKKSGLLGITGSSDLRAVIEGAQRGEARAQLGLDMLVHRIKKYIGAYVAVLGGQVDAVVFSAGIGENSSLLRGLVMEDMQGLGLQVDPDLNRAAVGGRQGDISAPSSRVKVLVIPTDEELSIAQQTLQVVEQAQLQLGADTAAAAAAAVAAGGGAMAA